MIKNVMLLSVLATLIPFRNVEAQTLADKVPADAIVTVFWSGTADLGPDYPSSHLKSILDQSNVARLFDQVYPGLTRLAEQKNPSIVKTMTTIGAIAGPLSRHPVAFHFDGLIFNKNAAPIPKLVLICDAGSEAAAIQSQFDSAIKELPDSPVKVTSFVQGSIVGVACGYADAAQAMAGSGGSLASAPTFQAAMKQLSPHPVTVTFVDGPHLMSLIDQGIAQMQNPQATQGWDTAKANAALDGVHSFASSGAFVGKDWESLTFVDAPEPRTGLAAWLTGSSPISPELLSIVPQSATAVNAAHLDLAALISGTDRLLGQINPQAKDSFDKGLGLAQMMTGKNIVTDVLQPLGSEWASYSAPEIGGGGFLGTVLVNKLRDPEKMQQSLAAITIALGNIATSSIAQSGIAVSTQTAHFGDVDVTYFAVPYLSPAWTIKDGYLYVGLFPQTAGPAAQLAEAHGPSITANPKYTSVMQQLGVHAPQSIEYSDLAASEATLYQAVLVYSRLGLGFSDMAGVPVPEPIVPPFAAILTNLDPSAAVTWSDAAGLHGRSTSPFPGSNLISVEGGGIGVAALSTSILLPSLNRARETANRIKCASNERQIGQACLLFGNDHRGHYPDSIADMMKNEEITAEVFICPSANTAIPADKQGDDLIKWVNDNSDFVYCGKGMTTSAPADEIAVYEKPGDHGGDGMNILFGDGHVEFVRMADAVKMIEAQKKTVDAVPLPHPATPDAATP